MIDAQVTGDTEVIIALGRLNEAAHGRIVQAVTRNTLRLQTLVKAGKLSGQVLNVRTGTLRRSIDQVVHDDGDVVRGEVDTNVHYARAHEYGWRGTQTVGAHLRTIKQVFGKRLKTPKTIMIGTHARTVNMPERSFLRSALREIEPLFREDIRKAVGGL